MSAEERPNVLPRSAGGHAGRRRPATINELGNEAKENLWDPSKGLKHWLRTAEKARKDGQRYYDKGDYEPAFVEFAKAATIVLDHLPMHREYQTLLSPEQRHNLGVNGQEILDSLSTLKPILVQRYNDWQNSAQSSRSSSSEPPVSETREETARRKREGQQRAQEEERARQALEAARREHEWKREELSRRQSEDRERRVREETAWAQQPNDVRRRDATANVAEARRAAEAREMAEHERNAQVERLRREEETRRQQSEDERRRRTDDRRRQEQEGIARRQQEADAAARAARRDIVATLSPGPAPPSSQPVVLSAGRPQQDFEVPSRTSREVSMPVAAPHPSRPSSSSQNQGLTAQYGRPAPPMPLESPTRFDYDSSTDVEGQDERKMPWHRPRQGHPSDQTPTKSKHLTPSIVYPPPLTTTSPAPPDMSSIRYPSLMSQHQLKQGYVPSLQSMFSDLSLNSAAPNSSLLFDSKPPGDLYSNILPKSSTAVIPPYPHGMPAPDTQRQFQYSQSFSHTGQRGPSPSGARPPPPPIPPKEPIPPPSTSRIARGDPKDPSIRDLKTIRLPRECLPKFLSIARVNTAQNRETCGLLLGKDKGSKYVVTTLLIPKQRSTSDTCTMDEEELVLQFTEERHLITLGWIHTHPTQSCFMSSVDLHTHSGFQRMLPESFAVVCAPSSTPTFGIFRLTDPEGLHTVLACTAKEAFHPHPEVPIYTDCDNSHVQMKDSSLEIVDLRS